MKVLAAKIGALIGKALDATASEDLLFDQVKAFVEAQAAQVKSLGEKIMGLETKITELTGPAFDLTGRRLYFSSQRGGPSGAGITYEVEGPFGGGFHC